MYIQQDGIDVYCLPDDTYCKADPAKQSPLDLDICPLGYEICNGDCIYFTERNNGYD